MKIINMSNMFPQDAKAFYFDGENYEECINTCPDLYYEGEPGGRGMAQTPSTGYIQAVCFKNTWVVRADNGELFLVPVELFDRIYYPTDTSSDFRPVLIPEFKSQDVEPDKEQQQRYVNISRMAERKNDESDFRAFKEQQESLRRGNKVSPGMSAEELVYLRQQHPECGL